MKQNSILSRVIGYVGSLILTLTAFIVIIRPEYFHLTVSKAPLVILILAVGQAVLQCICFLHLWKEKGLPWNLIMFTSTIVMAAIIIAFSVWIMNHLNYNMMYFVP